MVYRILGFARNTVLAYTTLVRQRKQTAKIPATPKAEQNSTNFETNYDSRENQPTSARAEYKACSHITEGTYQPAYFYQRVNNHQSNKIVAESFTVPQKYLIPMRS